LQYAYNGITQLQSNITVKNRTHAHTHTVAYTKMQSVIKINSIKSEQINECDCAPGTNI